MQPRDLLAKIEWEGGVVEAISYGIKAEEVPEAIRGDWESASRLVDSLENYEYNILQDLEALCEGGKG